MCCVRIINIKDYTMIHIREPECTKECTGTREIIIFGGTGQIHCVR